LLLILFGVLVVATLGPKLHIAGREHAVLPWRALTSLPLIKYALPGRLMAYVFLIVAVVVALWLVSSRTPVWTKWALIPLAIASLIPNWRGPFFNSPVEIPAFFRDGLYRQYLEPGENTIVIPYGDHGHSMLWQANAGMSFRMAGGYVTVVPPKEFAGRPVLAALYDGMPYPGVDADLRAFLRTHAVGAILVTDGAPGPWPELFGPIDPAPVDVGGVTVYRVPPSTAIPP
jgi:hypothetical protein